MPTYINGRINMAHPAFIEGYHAGADDPGFLSKTVPASIPNKFPPGSDEYVLFEAGFKTAIE